MSNKRELEARQDALQAELDNLKKTIEGMPDEGPWVPKIGDGYYTLSPGDVEIAVWRRYNGSVFDLNRAGMGIAFRTEEEAEHALEVIKQTNFKPYPPMGTLLQMECGGSWIYDGPWLGTEWQKGKWHSGALRVKA